MSLFGGIEIPGQPDLENVRRLDLLPIPAIRRAQRYGIEINVEHFYELESRLVREMAELEKDIASYIPPDRLHEFGDRAAEIEDEIGDVFVNPSSAVQIGKLLFDILGIGRERQLKKTKTGDRISTGKKQLELIQLDHPIVRKVLDHRERKKLVTTFCRVLPKAARLHPRGADCPVCGMSHSRPSRRVHTEFPTTRAETGRLSSRRPNLMQVSGRTELGLLIRQGFVAGEGNVLVSSDLSQIELRDMAHCANAESMKKVYREDLDIHMFTACTAFGLDVKHYTNLLNREKQDKKLAGWTESEKTEWSKFKLHNRLPSKNLNFMVCLHGEQKVLTNRGYVPIVNVSKSDLLWDGLEWVKHEGVIFKGFREVVTHQGITGTPDHKVWLADGRLVPLAAALAGGLELALGASGTTPIGHTSDRFQKNRDDRQSAESPRTVLQVLSQITGCSLQSAGGFNPWLYLPSWGSISKSSSAGCDPTVAVSRDETADLQSKLRILQRLWRARDRGAFSGLGPFRELCFAGITAPDLQGSGYWQNRQRRSLRRGEPAVRDSWLQSTEYAAQHLARLQGGSDRSRGFIRPIEERLSRLQSQPITNQTSRSLQNTLARDPKPGTKILPVYDILNAGPRRRFTCEGKLVSNCYGATVVGLLAQLALSGLIWSEDEGNRFIDRWFNLYPEVREYMDVQRYRARRYGRVWDIFGRYRLIPAVQSTHKWIQEEGLRQAGNFPIQAAAAAQFKLGMARTDAALTELREAGAWAWPMLFIHDQIITEVEEDFAEDVGEIQTEAMSGCMTDVDTGEHRFRVPIKSDTALMPYWRKD